MFETLKPATRFLAFDTSTDRLSIALTDGVRVWQHSGAGGAQASSTLIPAILALLAEAGLQLGELDAIAFGRGPGSFTGLRTACAVAQGLAFGARIGAGMPVLPIDTLMAVAEEARFEIRGSPHPPSTSSGQAKSLPLAGEGARAEMDTLRVTALLDARMDEMYVQSYEFNSDLWKKIGGCELIRPENLADYLLLVPGTQLLAGNVFDVYAQRLPATMGIPHATALPTATALLRLAPALAAAGQCVDASLALPLYVRDKVAFTTDERAASKALAAHTLTTTHPGT